MYIYVCLKKIWKNIKTIRWKRTRIKRSKININSFRSTREAVLAAAATRFGLLWFADVDFGRADAWRAWNSLHSILDLGCHRHKCLFDVCCVLCAGLEKRDSQMVGKFLLTKMRVLRWITQVAVWFHITSSDVKR